MRGDSREDDPLAPHQLRLGDGTGRLLIVQEAAETEDDHGHDEANGETEGSAEEAPPEDVPPDESAPAPAPHESEDRAHANRPGALIAPRVGVAVTDPAVPHVPVAEAPVAQRSLMA